MPFGVCGQQQPGAFEGLAFSYAGENVSERASLRRVHMCVIDREKGQAKPRRKREALMQAGSATPVV